jgi:tetratricopeptide (TPR) repeat protein
MRILAMAMLLCLVVTGCPQGVSMTMGSTPQERFDEAIAKLAKATTDEERFYALDDAAKESFQVGKAEDARKYARELLALLPKFKENWNYGNAVQDANLVLGRIASREGRTDEAKRYLIEAGNSPGSPQMDSFGPNMSLAKDMLEKGEGETVLKYFELCRKFWTMDRGRLDGWSNEIKSGRIPQFGANLGY